MLFKCIKEGAKPFLRTIKAGYHEKAELLAKTKISANKELCGVLLLRGMISPSDIKFE